MDRPTRLRSAKCAKWAFMASSSICADYTCSHSVKLSAERWVDDVRLSNIEGSLSGRLAVSAVRIGLDLAKRVFQVHGVEELGKVVVCKALRRGDRRRLVTSVGDP
jgi:hypothetical protein